MPSTESAPPLSSRRREMGAFDDSAAPTQLDRIETLLTSINDRLRDTVRAIERQHDTLGRSERRQARMAESPSRVEAR